MHLALGKAAAPALPAAQRQDGPALNPKPKRANYDGSKKCIMVISMSLAFHLNGILHSKCKNTFTLHNICLVLSML